MSLDNFKFISADLTAKTIRDASGRCWKIVGLTSAEEVDPSLIVNLSEAGFQETFACCAKCTWTEINEVCASTTQSSSSSGESSSSSSSSSSSGGGGYYGYGYYGYYGYYNYYGYGGGGCPAGCIDDTNGQQPIEGDRSFFETLCIASCQASHGDASCDPAGYLADVPPDWVCHCCYKESSSSSSSSSGSINNGACTWSTYCIDSGVGSEFTFPYPPHKIFSCDLPEGGEAIIDFDGNGSTGRLDIFTIYVRGIKVFEQEGGVVSYNAIAPAGPAGTIELWTSGIHGPPAPPGFSFYTWSMNISIDVCQVLTLEECELVSGTYHGDNTNCPFK